MAPLLRTQPAVRLDVSSSAGGVQIQVPLSKPPAFAHPYSTTLALLSREQGGAMSPRQGAVTRLYRLSLARRRGLQRLALLRAVGRGWA